MIQRYDLGTAPYEEGVRLLEDSIGDWVRYEDVENALVPVPCGEPVSLYDCEETYVQHNGRVYQACDDGEWYTVANPHACLFTTDDDTLVQPVRVVRVRDMEDKS